LESSRAWSEGFTARDIMGRRKKDEVRLFVAADHMTLEGEEVTSP
jgi:hypothetical protein